MPEGPEGRQTHGQPSNATLQLSPADSFRRKEAAARALEAKLREVSRNARNFYDQPVRQLRARLRDAYAEVLLEDPQAAQAHEIDTALWKWVFYKPIEEFRHRVRFAADAGQKGEEPLRKVKVTLQKFISEATGFYLHLITDLQAAHGDVGLQVGRSTGSIELHDEQLLSAADRGPAAVSIYRCMICLGDLARYQANVPSAASRKDWSRAQQYYQTAARVYPAGGNAHNQLAVLATYRDDERSAVYHYFRSLAVAEPFLIARENLLLLFEQNLKRAGGALDGHQADRNTAQQRQQSSAPQAQRSRSLSAEELLQRLYTRFIRLQGVLFTRINMDLFGAIYDDVFADLEAALGPPQTLHALTLVGSHGTPSALLQMTVMAIFSVHDAGRLTSVAQPRYAEAMQQAEVLRHGMTTACCLATQLMRRLLSPAGFEAEMTQQGLMAPLQLLLSWFADYNSDGMADPTDARDLAAYKQFWTAAAECLRWAGHEAIQEVQVAQHRLQEPSWPLTAEDVQLTGFIPLQSSWQTVQSPALVDGTERIVRIIAALLQCRQQADRLKTAGSEGGAQAALPAAAQLFLAACDGLMETNNGCALAAYPSEPSSPPLDGTEPAAVRDSEHDADMEAEEVIVYAPQHAISNTLGGSSPQPPAGFDASSDARQVVVVDTELNAHAGSAFQHASCQPATSSGDVLPAERRSDARCSSIYPAPVLHAQQAVEQPAGPHDNADDSAMDAERSTIVEPAAPPLNRPHGMLGWDLFENARASAGFPALFAATMVGAEEEYGQPQAGAPSTDSLGQDWSWLDTLAEQD